jgi:hypothetical protein
VGGWTITTAPIGFTLEELAGLKLELLDGAPYASRVSLGLALRLVQHPNEKPAVLREIDGLEGLRPATTTKIVQFKHAPLASLWHKHFFRPRHMPRNIGERWNIARGQGNRDLDSVLSEVARKYGMTRPYGRVRWCIGSTSTALRNALHSDSRAIGSSSPSTTGRITILTSPRMRKPKGKPTPSA